MGINILRQHVQAVFRFAMSITRRKEVAARLVARDGWRSAMYARRSLVVIVISRQFSALQRNQIVRMTA